MASAAGGPSAARAGQRPGSKAVWWPMVAAFAATKGVFQLATSGLYGMHRDEFYYWQSGRHLAWGYVDNPPLVPWLYRLAETIFGTRPIAFAVLPALLGALYVVLAAAITADLGGYRSAQLIAASIAWLAPIFLTTSHFLSTVSIDLLCWAVASWLVIRIVATRNPRLWVPVGAVCGLGLLNKDTIAFWAVSTAVGLATTPQRRLLASRWLLAGLGIAALIGAPNIAWEISHHWPTIEFLRNLRSNNFSTDLTQFVPLQLGIMTLAGTAVWFAALRALRRRPSWREQRWLAHGYAASFVLLFALGGKPYYLGSWYLPLIAVGGVCVEQYWTTSRRRALTAAIVATGAVTAPLFTPVLPAAAAHAAGITTSNKDLGGMLGWPHLVTQVADVVHRLPASEQHSAVILTYDYSEAGAVDFYGPHDGLTQRAISGHNTFWLWGPGNPEPGATVIAVGLPAAFVHTYWASAQLRTTLTARNGIIDPQEDGVPVWICRHQLQPWTLVWPTTKHYD